jgi:rhomboid protease GluP
VEAAERRVQAVRVAPTWRQADEWALVLSATGIAHWVDPHDDRFTLLVFAEDAPRAHAVLAAYDEETAREAGATREEDLAVAEPEPTDTAWTLSVAIALLLLGFFALTGPPAAGSAWFEQGAASAEAMTREPWRAITALTLHVDAVHAAGNAVATAVLLPAVAVRLGPGFAVLLLLVAGASANLLGAMLHEARHAAVGASTATFGAIGALTALRLFPGRRVPAPRRKGWTVVVTGLVLLAMLGAGENADVLAHVLGLLTGAVLGLGAGIAFQEPPRPRAQWLLGVAAAWLVLGCWRLALAGA